MAIEDRYANTIVEDDLSERWQNIFQRIANGETGLFTWSILGFLFGPAYYLYLRMFRKGFTIIGFILAGWFVGALLGMLIGKDLGGAINFAACVFCAKRVKTDYYRFKCLGETNWPQMKPIDSVGALSAFVGLSALAVVSIASIADSGTTHSAFSNPMSHGDQFTLVLAVTKTPDITNESIHYLTIMNRSDSPIILNDVKINRGACQHEEIRFRPPLKFGETVKMFTYCDPIEAVVETNLGTAQFSWSR